MPKTEVTFPLVGADGNVFVLLGIATKALRRAGHRDLASELTDRITSAGSYEEALSIIGEYGVIA